MPNWKVTLLMFTMFALVAAGCGNPFASDSARGSMGKTDGEPLNFSKNHKTACPMR